VLDDFKHYRQRKPNGNHFLKDLEARKEASEKKKEIVGVPTAQHCGLEMTRKKLETKRKRVTAHVEERRQPLRRLSKDQANTVDLVKK